MTYQMEAKRMSGGDELHHITDFKVSFKTPKGATLTGELTRAEVVKMIETKKERFFVIGDDKSEADCEVVDASPKYVKSKPDKSKRDNLLSLRSF
jgi:hypothetical protein